MGNLHLGHLSLIERSLKENKKTVVTIFVNPKQFGPKEDYSKYPRTLEEDLEKIESLSEAMESEREIIVFAPNNTKEIYPKGFASEIRVIAPFSQILCAKDRPGHFDGVTTVVYLLLSLIKPSKAYFGLKDYQQFKLIQKMTLDLLWGIEIEGLKIIRDEDGLALSSRNQYLSESERKKALNLPNTLKKLASLVDFSLLISKREETLSSDSNWIYLEVLNSDDLSPADKESKEVILLGAYRVGQTRLIDNLVVKRC